MTALQVDIVPFQDHHQADIDVFMTMIANEFTDSIFSPQSKTIKEVSLLPTDKYWVALIDGKVIGTIGLSTFQNNAIALKRMFLNEAFRGQGVSKTLLDTVVNFAIDNKVSSIYLGTMTQFKAAQKFYEKHGFKRIPQTALPIEFPVNPVDKIFYRRGLNKIYR
ncbi:MAG: GNAT family N-acetyltransferase [Sphingobacteriaceae bacterium]|nr:GNAT family N-acetyltransferase [Sphingobacteriaceae bacterium]